MKCITHFLMSLRWTSYVAPKARHKTFTFAVSSPDEFLVTFGDSYVCANFGNNSHPLVLQWRFYSNVATLLSDISYRVDRPDQPFIYISEGMSSPVCLSSVVCRLSVTFVHPTQAIEIFANISTPFGTLAIPELSIKILRRSSQGNPSVGG